MQGLYCRYIDCVVVIAKGRGPRSTLPTVLRCMLQWQWQWQPWIDSFDFDDGRMVGWAEEYPVRILFLLHPLIKSDDGSRKPQMIMMRCYRLDKPTTRLPYFAASLRTYAARLETHRERPTWGRSHSLVCLDGPDSCLLGISTFFFSVRLTFRGSHDEIGSSVGSVGSASAYDAGDYAHQRFFQYALRRRIYYCISFLLDCEFVGLSGGKRTITTA